MKSELDFSEIGSGDVNDIAVSATVSTKLTVGTHDITFDFDEDISNYKAFHVGNKTMYWRRVNGIDEISTTSVNHTFNSITVNPHSIVLNYTRQGSDTQTQTLMGFVVL